MHDLGSFYKNKIEKATVALKKVKKQLSTSSTIRLITFLLLAFLIYIFFGNTKLVLGIILAGIVLFLFLVSRHTDLLYKKDKLAAILKINTTELEILDRKFDQRPAGNRFKNSSHNFSEDIDLFGSGSFYQYSNRTALAMGSQTLAKIFTENAIDQIEEKQKAISELAAMPDWRQDFMATASLTKTQKSIAEIQSWLANYGPFIPSIMKYLPNVFGLISVLLFGLYFFNIASESLLLTWLVTGFFISGLFSKKISKLGNDSTKAQSTFEQFHKLLYLIEQKEFNSEFLREQKEHILKEGRKTSDILKDFSKLLGSLDQNNNIFYLILGNGFFLRAIATSSKIEKWIETHGDAVKTWFETTAFFDAYISLGTFAFNHPQYTYPKITTDNIILNSKNAGHPLLEPNKGITNDFKINKEQFFIITGANMAGKSTFLRTISLQLMMANIGLPVCATDTVYNPIKLITSMRTTDSLTDDESYFFSELKRLKFIVEEIQSDRYFIVLDEILKGTNSTDKAIGSRKFVEKLVASKSTGIIATHDLSLCEIAKDYDEVKNYYFDAEIIDDELHFDYKFKEGICKNMNASFLLKKMKIVD